LIGFVVVFLTASLSFASVIIWRKGKWPGPWPKQLKPYRQQTEGEIDVKVVLLFRRAFKELMDQKDWDIPDIVMEQKKIEVE